MVARPRRPSPLTLFIAGLTGCLVTQIRAFAKRLDVQIDGPDVECEIVWNWAKAGRFYKTSPESLRFDVLLDSPSTTQEQLSLIAAARKGCFIEQTLGQSNVIHHWLKTANGFVDA